MSNPHEIQYANTLRSARLSMFYKICHGLETLDLENAETRKTFFEWQENAEKTTLWKFEIEAFLNKNIANLAFVTENVGINPQASELANGMGVQNGGTTVMGPIENMEQVQVAPAFYNNTIAPATYQPPDHLGPHPVTYFNPAVMSPQPNGQQSAVVPVEQKHAQWAPENQVAPPPPPEPQNQQIDAPYQPQKHQWNPRNQVQQPAHPAQPAQMAFQPEPARWSPQNQMQQQGKHAAHTQLPYQPAHHQWAPQNRAHQPIDQSQMVHVPYHSEQGQWNGQNQAAPMAQPVQWNGQQMVHPTSPNQQIQKSGRQEQIPQTAQTGPQRQDEPVQATHAAYQSERPPIKPHNQPPPPPQQDHRQNNPRCRVQQPSHPVQPLPDQRQFNTPNQMNPPAHQNNGGAYGPRPLMKHNHSNTNRNGPIPNGSYAPYFHPNQYPHHGNYHQGAPTNFGSRPPLWEHAPSSSSSNRYASNMVSHQPHHHHQPYGVPANGQHVQPPMTNSKAGNQPKYESREVSPGSRSSSGSNRQNQNGKAQPKPSNGLQNQTQCATKRANYETKSSSKAPLNQNGASSSARGQPNNQGRHPDNTPPHSKTAVNTAKNSSALLNERNATRSGPVPQKTTNGNTRQGNTNISRQTSRTNSVNDAAQRVLTPPESPEGQVEEIGVASATPDVGQCVASPETLPVTAEAVVTPETADPSDRSDVIAFQDAKNTSSGATPESSAGTASNSDQLPQTPIKTPVAVSQPPMVTSSNGTSAQPAQKPEALPVDSSAPGTTVPVAEPLPKPVPIEETLHPIAAPTAETLPVAAPAVDSPPDTVPATETVDVCAVKADDPNTVLKTVEAVRNTLPESSCTTTHESNDTNITVDPPSCPVSSEAQENELDETPILTNRQETCIRVESLSALMSISTGSPETSNQLAQEIVREIETAVSENLNLPLQLSAESREDSQAVSKQPKKSYTQKAKKNKKKTKKQAPPPSKSETRARHQEDLDFLDAVIEKNRRQALANAEAARAAEQEQEQERSDAADTEDEEAGEEVQHNRNASDMLIEEMISEDQRPEITEILRKILSGEENGTQVNSSNFNYSGPPASSHLILAVYNGITMYIRFLKKCADHVLTDKEVEATPEFYKQMHRSGVDLTVNGTAEETEMLGSFLSARLSYLEGSVSPDVKNGNNLRSVIYVALRKHFEPLLYPTIIYLKDGQTDTKTLMKLESEFAKMLLILAPGVVNDVKS